MMGRFIVVILALTICASRSNGAIFPDCGPTTSGLRASLCGGIALAPAQAPLAVKRAILGGKSIALEAVSLRWRPLLLSRQRLRLFRNCFVCSWWCGFNLVADELIGFSSLWAARTGAMDYRLRPQWTYVRGHRGPKIGYDAWRELALSLGPALANDLSRSGRV
jgi:hypothetical protein